VHFVQYSVSIVVCAEKVTPLPDASRTTGTHGWKRNVIFTETGCGEPVTCPMPGPYQMYPVFGTVGTVGQLPPAAFCWSLVWLGPLSHADLR